MQQAMQVRRLLTKEAARRRDSEAGRDWITSGGIVVSDSGEREKWFVSRAGEYLRYSILRYTRYSPFQYLICILDTFSANFY